MSSSVPTWKIVLAAFLDFLTIFFVAGFIISAIFGGRTGSGFNLEGMPALLLFAVVIAYFVLAPRFGGTLWQRILKTRR